MSDVIYQYDGSLDGFLCCVFESYVYKESPAAFCCGEDPLSLYEVRTVITQPAYSQRVSRGIEKRSPKALTIVRHGFLTCLPGKELHLYAFIRKLLAEGPGFMRDLSDPACYSLYRAIRHMNGELEKLRGFVRFSDYGGTLGAEIAPKNRVLPLLRGHFCQRYANEQFFIFDRTHKELLLYANGRSRITHVEDYQAVLPEGEELFYRSLWKRFFESVTIRERENPRCQDTFLPKRYRGLMTEFQPLEHERQRIKDQQARPGLSEQRKRASIPPDGGTDARCGAAPHSPP